MNIDGTQLLHVKNDNPLKFENVKVYAGDKYHEAADAEVRNFNVLQSEAKGFLMTTYMKRSI